MSRDAQGQTPFMLAVGCRAYHAALYILDTIQRLVARTPTSYEDITPSSVTSTEEKLKNVLSAWFAKGETSDSAKKQNYPSWLYPSGSETGKVAFPTPTVLYHSQNYINFINTHIDFTWVWEIPLFLLSKTKPEKPVHQITKSVFPLVVPNKTQLETNYQLAVSFPHLFYSSDSSMGLNLSRYKNPLFLPFHV